VYRFKELKKQPRYLELYSHTEKWKEKIPDNYPPLVLNYKLIFDCPQTSLTTEHNYAKTR
jgi:hypothetical protein